MRRLLVLLITVALTGLTYGAALASSHDLEIEAEVPKEVGKGANGSIVVKFRYKKRSYRGSAPIDSAMTKAEKAKAVKDAIDGAKSVTGLKPVGVTATVNGDKVDLHAPGADRPTLKAVKLSESDTITGITRDLFGTETGRKKLSYRFFEDVVDGYLDSVGFTSFLGTVSHSVLLDPGTTGPQATAIFQDYFATQAAALAAIGLVPQTLPDDEGWVLTRTVYPYDIPLTVFGEGEGLEVGISQVPLPAPIMLLASALARLGLIRRLR